MASVRLIAISSVLALTAALAAPRSLAQEGPGGSINPGRDCRVITTCNYARGGSYRGCLSSYSCRVCRYVPGSCRAGRGKRCYESRCTWG